MKNHVVTLYTQSVSLENIASQTQLLVCGAHSCDATNTFELEAVDINEIQTSGQINFTFTPPVTNIGTVTSCNTVTEYIEYSISGGAQQLFISDITQNSGGNGSSFSKIWGMQKWRSEGLTIRYSSIWLHVN